MPLPTYLIVGVPRAGTTSLAAYLAGHPDILMAPSKELHFFNARYDRGVDWYGAQFTGKRDAVQRGEATPGYLFDHNAVRLMARTVPDAKLIVMLREPVDRAYSHFWLNRWRGIESLSFEAALDAEDDRRRRRPRDPRRAYFGIGCYTDQLRYLLDHFPAEQVHTVFFEDLTSRPDELVTSVCRYLGVREVVPEATGDRHNHHGPVRSVRLAMLARKLPGPLCRGLRDWNTMDTEYPPVDQHTRRALAERFAGANAGLPSLLGRPVPWAP